MLNSPNTYYSFCRSSKVLRPIDRWDVFWNDYLWFCDLSWFTGFEMWSFMWGCLFGWKVLVGLTFSLINYVKFIINPFFKNLNSYLCEFKVTIFIKNMQFNSQISKITLIKYFLNLSHNKFINPVFYLHLHPNPLRWNVATNSWKSTKSKRIMKGTNKNSSPFNTSISKRKYPTQSKINKATKHTKNPIPLPTISSSSKLKRKSANKMTQCTKPSSRKMNASQP